MEKTTESKFNVNEKIFINSLIISNDNGIYLVKIGENVIEVNERDMYNFKQPDIK